MRARWVGGALAFLFLVPFAALASPLLLRPAQVWTAGEPLHSGWVVLIEGNRIAAVGPAGSVSATADATVIELPGATLLPGLMDIH